MGYHGNQIEKESDSDDEEVRREKAEEEKEERKEKEEEERDEEEERREKAEEEEEEGEEDPEEGHRDRVIVKGYMRPDGTSYYVVIPKEIRELFGLKGGEYFLIKPKPGKGKIELKIAKFVEE